MSERPKHVSISTIVIQEAPADCPDKKLLNALDIHPGFMEYHAYLVDDGEAECLGTKADVCTNCSLRVASYSIGLSGKYPRGVYRFPASEVTFNSAPGTSEDTE